MSSQAVPGVLTHLDPRKLRRIIAARFRAVRWIETAELGARLEQPSLARPLLLDARTPAEHTRSHLPGAHRIDPGATHFSELAATPATPIVVYCSVGYRSAALCARLQDAGLADVLNLTGGIFQWANEGRELCAGERRVHDVHPFSRSGSWWLRPECRGPLA